MVTSNDSEDPDVLPRFDSDGIIFYIPLENIIRECSRTDGEFLTDETLS